MEGIQMYNATNSCWLVDLFKAEIYITKKSGEVYSRTAVTALNPYTSKARVKF